MNPAVLISRSELLPVSETFIAAQAHALRSYSPVFAGLRRVVAGLELDPCDTVYLTGGNTLADKFRRRLFLSTGTARHFLRRLRRRNPVLVHAHFAVDAAAALPIAQKLELPLVVTLHGYDATMTDAALRSTAAGQVFLRRRERMWGYASAFICVSEHIRGEAKRQGVPEEKLHTIPIG